MIMNQIKKFIHWPLKYLPRSSFNQIALISNYIYFYRRISKHSSIVNDRDTDLQSRTAKYLMYSHSIEKGLSLKTPRYAFGKPTIDKLKSYLHDTRNRSLSGWIYQMISGVIDEYISFNNVNRYAESSQYSSSYHFQNGAGATVPLDKYTFVKRSSFSDFAMSRRSIRQYTGETVPHDDIEEAVKIAQKAPSVCNRQAVRVHLISENKRSDVLKLQNGNRGFSNEIGALLVITADTKSFFYPGELNQGFVDGGLFAMLLALAFHDMGYGTCMLNWCASSSTDKKLRQIISISPSEIVIMYFAVGVLPEKFKAALSQRRPLSEVLQVQP